LGSCAEETGTVNWAAVLKRLEL